MRFAHPKTKNTVFKNAALPVTVCGLLIFLFYFGISFLGLQSDEEELRAAERAVLRAAVSCYALEGEYPPTLDHLIENYGLTLDFSRFAVDYRCFASNLMPDVTVLPLESGFQAEPDNIWN